MVDVVARAQHFARHLVLLARQLAPHARPILAELGLAAAGSALAVELVLQVAVVLTALAAPGQVAVVEGRAALAEQILRHLAVAVPAGDARTAAHALRKVRMLLVAGEAPVRAAVRGGARLVRVGAQLPAGAEPLGRVAASAV